MRRITALLIASALAVTACAGGDSASLETIETSGGVDGEALDQSAEAPGDGRDLSVDLDVVDGRQVIRRATLELHADDTRSTYEEIVAMVEATGGFLANATVYPAAGESDQPQISLTARVPADQLNATMTAIKGSVDEVVSETQGTQDVTAEYIDLEARLTNLQALEVELRALLEEVRMQENADPEKLLQVFNEISGVRGQIEQIQGQLNYLSDLTALATLEIGITQTPSAVPIVDEPWNPGEVARDAIRDLVAGLQDVADSAIGFALYALPLLLLTAGPIILVGLFVYRRFFRKPRTPAATT
ncbi:MAG: DUF4349 domain-containing protein [Acidimicrobiia bacterium]|jgi:hypothetical protein